MHVLMCTCVHYKKSRTLSLSTLAEKDNASLPLNLVGIPISHHYMRLVLRQFFTCGQAQAISCAGYDHDSVAKILHIVCLPSVIKETHSVKCSDLCEAGTMRVLQGLLGVSMACAG